MAGESIRHMHIPTVPPNPTAGHLPMVPPLRPPPQCCERGGQWNFRSPISIPRHHQHLSPSIHRLHLPSDSALAAVEPSKRTRFCNSFCDVVDNITEGLSTSQSTAAGEHWDKWAAFCVDVALNPLLELYRDPVPVLNAFVQQ